MIYYVAYYSPKQEMSRRVSNIAGEDKIDYICNSINDFGEKVTILSNTKSNGKQFLNYKEYVESDKKQIVMFASLPKSNKIVHAINILYGYFQLAMYIIKNVNSNDTVIVYHSLGYRNIFKYIKKIKKFKYILEVEELYKYISASTSSFKKNEDKVFKYPDAFIFSNKELEKNINVYTKPFTIINGVYKMNTKGNIRPNRDVIRVLYAGSLEKQKGVDYVIKSAEFLDENYELRIIGFGTNRDIERVNSLISVTKTKSKCRIYYDGLFKGDEYINYIQNCDIGMCIQDPKDIFNKYEFPSKILSYMSNGLNVVANRLEQIENSEIYDHITICDGIEADKIAKCIKNTKVNDKLINNLFDELDRDFKNNLYNLINGGQ